MPDDDLFPLSLTPFEHYMLADDCPQRPMSIWLRVGYSGVLDRTRFDQAVTSAVACHPLLRANVVGELRATTRRLQWVTAEIPTAIEWCHVEHGSIPDRRLDLHTSPGLRLIVDENAAAPTIFIQCHHACCDAVGMVSFLETLLLAYRNQGRLLEQDKLALALDRRWWRNRARLSGAFYKHLLRSPHDVARIWKYFQTSTESLAPSPPTELTSSPIHFGRRFCFHKFTTAETSELIAAARDRGVTLNDLMLAKYFEVLAAWNTQHRPEATLAALRVAVPIDLREPNQSYSPAINRVSMVFLDRNRSTMQDPRELLRSIHREMKGVKLRQTGWTLLNVLELAGRVPEGMQRLVSTSGPKVSAVLSNLRRIYANSALANEEGKLQAESLVIEQLGMLVPLRSGVNTGVSAISYAGQLALTMNYEIDQLSNSSAQQLFHTLVQNLKYTNTLLK